VREHLAGHSGAFPALVRRYQKPVYRLALRYAKDVDEADELAQRTFLKVLDRMGALEPEQFRSYLFRAASNLCRNHLRDRAKMVLGVPLTIPAPDSEPLEDRQRRQQLREVLARLPLRQRQVVSLRIDAELPFAEIASALGITENNAKVTFHHAVKRLQKLYAEETP